MTRKKKLIYNTIFSLVYQGVALICGFVLPRFLLQYYGSEVNGLVSSITQFLGLITFAECGVGMVVESALYKPLAEKNDHEISLILSSAEKFFHKISAGVLIYTVGMMLLYPSIAAPSFDHVFTVSLIGIIAASSFVQYFFSITYSILLSADSLGYITYITRTITLILNTVLSLVLMKNGADITMVKLGSAVVFLLQPIVYCTYVKKNYNITKRVKYDKDPITNKWNGLAQHIAFIVLSNTDTVVLTLFSTLQNVSVYYVYNLVVSGVKQLILALTSGVQPLIGNMYAKKEEKALMSTFSFMEWGVHTVTTVLFSCTAILIVPFVRVYTNEIHDANYIVPTFAMLICAAVAAYCLRIPYNAMVLAAGHYKQTQSSAIIEAVMNIVASVLLVNTFGLVGVAIGTLIAMSYRTIYLAWYLSKNILYRNLTLFFKHAAVDILTIAAIGISSFWVPLYAVNYFAWVLQAAIVTIISVIVASAVNFIFYREELMAVFQKGKRMIKSRIK